MAAAPELAPAARDHLLRSSSTLQHIAYAPASITYTTFAWPSRERLRTSFEPREVRAGHRRLKRFPELPDPERKDGYYFEAAGPRKGLLEIRHSQAGAVVITK
jgi:hypothetical protein